MVLLFWPEPAFQALVVIIAASVRLSHWAVMLPVRYRVWVPGICRALVVPLLPRPSLLKTNPATVLSPIRFNLLEPFMVTTVLAGNCWA